MYKILKHVHRSNVPIVSSANKFRLGDVVVSSRRIIELCLEAPRRVPEIIVLMDVVPVDVPALFGLDVLDSENSYAENVADRLVHRLISSRSSDVLEYDDIWEVPMIRRDSYLYARMSFPQYAFYTSEQSLKIH